MADATWCASSTGLAPGERFEGSGGEASAPAGACEPAPDQALDEALNLSLNLAEDLRCAQPRAHTPDPLLDHVLEMSLDMAGDSVGDAPVAGTSGPSDDDSGSGLRRPRGTSRPMTRQVLLDWIALGPHGIRAAGGAAQVAASFGIPRSTISNYVRRDGSLTAVGERLMSQQSKAEYRPVTADLLLMMVSLGRPWLVRQGGLSRFAEAHNVCAATLRQHFRSDGSLTQVGLDVVNSAARRNAMAGHPNPALLCADTANSQLIEALGLGHYLHGGETQAVGGPSAAGCQAGPSAAGFQTGSPSTDFQAGPSAADLLGGPSSANFQAGPSSAPSQAAPPSTSANWRVQARQSGVTREVLQAWINMGKEGIQRAGGAVTVADRLSVKFTTLNNYVRVDGRLKPLGKRVMFAGQRRVTHPIGVELLSTLSALGRDGIRNMGGIDGLARRYGLQPWMLRCYLRADGSLTRFGEAVLHSAQDAPQPDSQEPRVT